MDATRGRKTDHDLEMEERQWLGFGKFLLLLGMAALFFVLAQGRAQVAVAVAMERLSS